MRLKGTVEVNELFEEETLDVQASPLGNLETQLGHSRMPSGGSTATHGKRPLEEVPLHRGVDTGPLHLNHSFYSHNVYDCFVADGGHPHRQGLCHYHHLHESLRRL